MKTVGSLLAISGFLSTTVSASPAANLAPRASSLPAVTVKGNGTSLLQPAGCLTSFH